MENEKVDMKIVKFEQMINEIHYYLWRSRVVPYPKDGDFVGTVISPFYLDHYLNWRAFEYKNSIEYTRNNSIIEKINFSK